MDNKIKEYIQSIEEVLTIKQYGEAPLELYEPIRYLMSLGGKRMRPLLSLLAYNLKHENPETIIEASISVEIFHNFTLMHDDIMDDAPLRRGHATVHEKWNSPIAILSGDVMLVKAYEQLIAHCPEDRLKLALEKFNKCATEVCEGQQHDMNFESLENVTIDQYIDMIRQKTAVLLGFSLELGGILAGMSNSDIDKLYEVGVQVGLGFQLMDDILDVYADQSKFGKQVGGDIISNKKTFLLLTALEKADSTQLNTLKDWMKLSDFNKDEKVSAFKSIYQDLHIREQAEEKMQAYFDNGFELLEQIEGRAEAKSQLKDFFNYLIIREK